MFKLFILQTRGEGVVELCPRVKNSSRCYAVGSSLLGILPNFFMEGLRTGVDRTENFRVHLLTVEEAVDMALKAEINYKATRYGTYGHVQNIV